MDSYEETANASGIKCSLEGFRMRGWQEFDSDLSSGMNQGNG
jgi:hypothetical protein